MSPSLAVILALAVAALAVRRSRRDRALLREAQRDLARLRTPEDNSDARPARSAEPWP